MPHLMYGTYTHSVPTLHKVQCDSTAKASRFILSIIQNTQIHVSNNTKRTNTCTSTGKNYAIGDLRTWHIYESKCLYRTSFPTAIHVQWGIYGGAVGWGTVLLAWRSRVQIPIGVIGIFHWLNPCYHLTKMSTWDISWGCKGNCLEIMGAWNTVMG